MYQVLHGLDTIQHKVHKDLLQLYAVTHDRTHSGEKSLWIKIECLDASPRSKIIISCITSFISTSSRCRVSFLNSDLTPPMISDARATSLTTLEAAACASDKSGRSRVNQREQAWHLSSRLKSAA